MKAEKEAIEYLKSRIIHTPKGYLCIDVNKEIDTPIKKDDDKFVFYEDAKKGIEIAKCRERRKLNKRIKKMEEKLEELKKIK